MKSKAISFECGTEQERPLCSRSRCKPPCCLSHMTLQTLWFYRYHWGERCYVESVESLVGESQHEPSGVRSCHMHGELKAFWKTILVLDTGKDRLSNFRTPSDHASAVILYEWDSVRFMSRKVWWAQKQSIVRWKCYNLRLGTSKTKGYRQAIIHEKVAQIPVLSTAFAPSPLPQPCLKWLYWVSHIINWC